MNITPMSSSPDGVSFMVHKLGTEVGRRPRGEPPRQQDGHHQQENQIQEHPAQPIDAPPDGSQKPAQTPLPHFSHEAATLSGPYSFPTLLSWRGTAEDK